MVLMGILGLEGAARLFFSDRRDHPVVPRDVRQFDERLGWSLKPLAQGSSHATGYEIEYRINSMGLRDDETTYEKPEGIFRIVLIGDSYTFGYGVPIEKHFSTLLEGYFNNVETINMGVDGFGIDQELLHLRAEGFRYEPDLVLAFVPHYGDHRHMRTKIWGKAKPRFVLVKGELVLTNSPIASKPLPLIPRKVHRWLRKHSNACSIFHEGFWGLRSRMPEILEALKGVFGLTSHEQPTISLSEIRPDETIFEAPAFRKELYGLGEKIIYTLHEESLAHGARFMLVTKIKELHEASLNNQLLSLNVSEPLSNPKFPLPEPFGHHNEPANGVLAWEIAKFLQTNQLIPPAHLYDKKP